jgi:hypothetical protein
MANRNRRIRISGGPRFTGRDRIYPSTGSPWAWGGCASGERAERRPRVLRSDGNVEVVPASPNGSSCRSSIAVSRSSALPGRYRFLDGRRQQRAGSESSGSFGPAPVGGYCVSP